MSVHIAIMKPEYAEKILSGVKTIESRMTRTSRPPFGQITPGDVIYFKASGGEYFARAEVSRAYFEDAMTPARMDRVKAQFNDQIGGDDGYWQSKRESTRYLSLAWLRDVRPCRVGPRYVYRHMCAWYVMSDDMDIAGEMDLGEVVPARLAAEHERGRDQITGVSKDWIEVTITGGALRQGYLAIGKQVSWFDQVHVGGSHRNQSGRLLLLRLYVSEKSGERVYREIETDIVEKGRRFRARGFKGYYAAIGAIEGDRLRIEKLGERLFTCRLMRD